MIKKKKKKKKKKDRERERERIYGSIKFIHEKSIKLRGHQVSFTFPILFLDGNTIKLTKDLIWKVQPIIGN